MNDKLEMVPLRFAEAWDRHDADAVFADYADDAEFKLEILETSIIHADESTAAVQALWRMTGHQAPNGEWGAERHGILILQPEHGYRTKMIGALNAL